MSCPLRSLPAEERPRERLERHGANALSTTELIAIVLGSGTVGHSAIDLAQVLLSTYGIAELERATVAELCTIKGLGRAKALKLKAALALAQRRECAQVEQRQTALTCGQIYQIIRPELEPAQEERFLAVLLDAKGGVIRLETVAVGTLTEALVHPREVFFPAVRHKAASFVVAHNHPSGDLTPSEADHQLTDRLLQVSALMDIPMHDHLIVGRGGYRSVRQQWHDSGKTWG